MPMGFTPYPAVEIVAATILKNPQISTHFNRVGYNPFKRKYL